MTSEIEKRLWGAADQLRANSQLESSEYSVSVLGLIFLRFADYKFTVAKREIDKIINQGYSLNPGRYEGVAEKEEEDFDFSEKLHALNEELERLNAEVHELEEKIAENVVTILEERPNE